VAFDIFLKFVGGAGGPLTGESIASKHANEIDVQSFSWGESRDGAAADPQELALVTPISKASPQIAKYCAEGTPIGSAVLSVNASSAKIGGELLMIKLMSVTVGSYQLGVADSDAQFTDRFTLAFQSVDIRKNLQNPVTGAVTAGDTVSIDFSPPAP
jgi:type VI protein secretion system component Hcp